ncbi:hypothetical protein G7085_06395 [Tessaracoccus sp. HDW20]|uniref:hypothetical protein n=1 Tax=Tessaracoccus coleopterorum TaxID=2714950 RepID=UPI0018D40425|nr:hypothetical protein [Tessaracoccus coleopterorum]NHB84357.1 hypothetical protein [Tessaracoccus coleopterorum]
MNHNAGWFRNGDGSLYEADGVKRIMFGGQDDVSTAWNADAWDLATVRITGNPTAAAAPKAFGLRGPADGAVLDPLNVNAFSWATSSGRPATPSGSALIRR